MDRGYRAVLSLLLAILGGGAVASVCTAQRPNGGPVTPSVQATPMQGMGMRPGFGPGPNLPPPGFQGLPPGGGRIRGAIMAARIRAQVVADNPAQRLARMTPEEREAFNRGLPLWQQMPPEERKILRERAEARNREEVLEALKGTGLQLNDDQRELFALRYKQERRKLERAIQDQANAERARRMPEIMEQLKHEFSGERQPPVVP